VDHARRITWLVVAFETSLGLVGAVAAWLLGIPWWEQLRPEPAALGLAVATAVMLGLVAWVFLAWPLRWTERTWQLLQDLALPLFRPMSTLQMLVAAASAGLGEELLFRGLIQNWLYLYLGPTLSVFLTGLLFGVMHSFTSFYFFLTTCIGWVHGALFHWTNSLLAPMVAHALYDFACILYLVRWEFPPPNVQKP
jgi:membrane protease YdiL (CAAX protease family)